MSRGVFEDLKVHLEEAMARYAPRAKYRREGLEQAIEEALTIASDRIAFMATLANTQIEADDAAETIGEAGHEAVRATLETERRERERPAQPRGEGSGEGGSDKED
jgi:hypothetical protein